MKARIATFDIMKGIAILLVIVGHCSLVSPRVINWIFSFHMPLFFLLSGYFHRISSDFITVCKKSAVRLLIPYCVTASVLLVYATLSAVRNCNITIFLDSLKAFFYASGAAHHSRFGANGFNIGPIWFLPALFWCKNIANYLLNKGIHPLIIFLIAIVATLLDYYVIHLPFAILPGLSAMSFFLVGHLGASTHVLSKESRWHWIVWICVACWPFAAEFAKAFMGTCTYKIFPLAFAGACGGTIIVYWISILVERYTPHFSPFLLWCGVNSMAILCVHTLVMNTHIIPHIPFAYNHWIILLTLEISVALLLSWICSKIPLLNKIFGMQ